jgi:hypothetical protein
VKDNDQKLLWEAYQQLHESTADEAIQNIFNCITNPESRPHCQKAFENIHDSMTPQEFQKLIKTIADMPDQEFPSEFPKNEVLGIIDPRPAGAPAAPAATPTAAVTMADTPESKYDYLKAPANAKYDPTRSTRLARGLWGEVQMVLNGELGNTPGPSDPGEIGYGPWFDANAIRANPESAGNRLLNIELTDTGAIIFRYIDMGSRDLESLSNKEAARIQVQQGHSDAGLIDITWSTPRSGELGNDVIFLTARLPDTPKNPVDEHGKPLVFMDTLEDDLRANKENSVVGSMMTDILNDMNAGWADATGHGGDDVDAYA